MSALLNPSVPVPLESSCAGLASDSGLLRLESNTPELETKDDVLQMLKSGVKRVAVPLTEVEACRATPGWFGGKIEISVRSMSLLNGIAGAARGRMMFGVSRKDRDEAWGFGANVELALAHCVVRAAEESGRP